MKNYGKELILDLHECNPEKFNRKDLKRFFTDICDLIDMEKCKLCWWDDLHTPEDKKETEPHLVGTSAIQFIKTSNITIHTLDIMKRVYLNVFSCKEFDPKVAKQFCIDFFQCKNVAQYKVIERR